MRVLYVMQKNANKAFDNFIRSRLAQQYNITVVANQTISCVDQTQNRHDLILLFSNQIKTIQDENAIVLVKDTSGLQQLQKVGEDCRIILPSILQTELQHLTPYHPKLYTCGFGCKDHITFSSREEDAMSIALLRSLKTVFGEKKEPFEITEKLLLKCSDYETLSAYMLLILLGVI